MIYNIDFYKAGHVHQYPEGLEKVYANFTPRSFKHANFLQDDYVVFFGLQAVLERMRTGWAHNFFYVPKWSVLSDYEKLMSECLGAKEFDVSHLEKLHDLQYLPLEIKALPEGSKVGQNVPCYTITNTHRDHAWLVNYVETWMSAELWQSMTSATIAHEFKKLFIEFAQDTGADETFVDFQGHDFSFRGMSSTQSAINSGMGHLLSFKGTDTIPAIRELHRYYNADLYSTGFSVPATEHSVMCSGTKEGELETYRRLVKEVYPSGIVSIVSDTWDLWGVIDGILPKLKDDILKRDGKVVIRPDSGDPVDIVPEAVQRLDKVFGHTLNDKGFKELDPHIGLIYGDSIDLSNAREILRKLKKLGYASSNIVFGIGSFQYQYNTRDTFGTAIKTTNVTIDGVSIPISKDPATDTGFKKSAKGMIESHGPDYKGVHRSYKDGLDSDRGTVMKTVFYNGGVISEDFEDIRRRLHV